MVNRQLGMNAKIHAVAGADIIQERRRILTTDH